MLLSVPPWNRVQCCYMYLHGIGFSVVICTRIQCCYLYLHSVLLYVPLWYSSTGKLLVFYIICEVLSQKMTCELDG